MKSIRLTTVAAVAATAILVTPALGKTFWDELNQTAPRTLFDDLRDSAPRTIFDDLRDSAPVHAPEAEDGRVIGE